ncbi:conserved hypothetical protein [Salmonella enterica subsp. enterica serovar Hadar str. RI_05P066]|uniref:Uncharacterized protein n=1 Tax=Salmonella enterica subsp. enterica serovar Choleraesuis str. SCSA50 TaxID=904139 RepID=A0AAJ8WP43_SALET|nr:conserved hypothetical protein [Salmonella enterica subsp. enterica serovar Hadar str. RI_05P066]EFZ08364.1 hypothetical protein SCA50_3968 [Salmonella enterica subsp. enterica serovar Choleraesuis str. SCSA50]OSJ38796.1 hypothetical protein K804_07465 [Salmonella enterica subsp. enterica serovar Newport str. SHSN014]VGM88910.1 hypothetical protein UPM517_1224 [Salmonella enterica subsp. enterica serovar Stanley]VXG75118.1 hypothetical protein CDS [Salmonella enterica subsp. enterica serovar
MTLEQPLNKSIPFHIISVNHTFFIITHSSIGCRYLHDEL